MAGSKAKRTAPSSQSTEELRSRILAYLEAHNTMTIACCRQDQPWAAAVFYASDGFDLYFFSNPHSRHGMNMAANPSVSITIHEDYGDWREIRGIQLEGLAERVRSPKLKIRCWELYRRKFPFVDEFFRPGSLRETLQSKLTGIRFYRIVPHAIWYLDNSRGFGHRELLPLPPISKKV